MTPFPGPDWRGWVGVFARYNRACRTACILLALSVLAAQGVRAINKPYDGDFFLHWHFGQRFIEGGNLYAGGHTPYPPFWGLAWSPASALSLVAAKSVCYAASPLAILILVFVLHRLTRDSLPLSREGTFWVAALALGLSARFVIRELPECGPNLMLLALSWLGIYAWSRHRDWWGGLSLGLAIALKCTPGLFLVFFAWKRQWKMTIATAAFAGAFTVAPACWHGTGWYARTMQTWLANVWLSTGAQDPAVGILGQEPVQNMSLRPAVARYLMRLPAGHIARQDHPAYLEFLDLHHQTAAATAKGVMLLLVVLAGWISRRPFVHRDRERCAWEFAAVSILMLLISPITWGQHCVAVLPACYLIARWVVFGRPRPGWVKASVIFFVLVNLVLNRGILGRETVLLLDSYYLPTWSLVGLFAVALGCSRLAGQQEEVGSLSSPPCKGGAGGGLVPLWKVRNKAGLGGDRDPGESSKTRAA